MKNIFSSFLFFGSLVVTRAQTPMSTTTDNDFIKSSYQLLADVGDVDITKKSISFKLQKMHSTNRISYKFIYEKSEYVFKDVQEDYLLHSLEESHLFGFSGTYIKLIKNQWWLHLQANSQINSTLKKVIGSNDIFIGGNLKISKIWVSKLSENKSELIISLNYDTLFGKPTLYPLISYSDFITNYINYTIGLPISYLNIIINEQQNITLSISPKSNYFNHSGLITLDNQYMYFNSKNEFSSLSFGLDYYIKFDNHWTTSLGIGYLHTTKFKILDNNNTLMYDLEPNDSITINFSLKFNLNKNK